MHHILFLLLLAGLIAPAHGEVLRLSEPAQAGDGWEVFGAPLEDHSAGITLAEAVTRLDRSPQRVTTRVKEVCQKKGCFFVAQDGDIQARVTFADYAFFVPTDSADKVVTLVGSLTREELSAEQAKHYAEDVGRQPDQALEGGFEYHLVATSVIVPAS